ncbi:MAG: hypothetical protein ACRBF0_24100 [Calditrichia bacterium]
MNKNPCSYTKQIRSEAKHGELNKQLKQHLSGCEYCREEKQIIDCFDRLKETVPVKPATLTSRQLWIRATLIQQQDMGRRRLRLIFLIQTGLQIFLAGILLTFFFWNRGSIIQGLQKLTTDIPTVMTEPNLVFWVIVGVVILVVNMLASLNWIIPEE